MFITNLTRGLMSESCLLGDLQDMTNNCNCQNLYLKQPLT